MQRKTRIVIFLLVFISLLNIGCWNRIELDQRAIVFALGIDQGEDKRIKITAQIIKTTSLKKSSENGGNSKGFYVLSASGDTVFEALRNFVTQSGRKLYYPHNKVIILGANLARAGVISVADLFLRDHEFRFLTWFLVTEGKASDIVEADSKIENIPAKQLDMLLKDYGVVSKTVAINLLEFATEVSDESMHPVVGRIELEQSGDQKGLVVKGAGVFERDKLSGWMTPMETQGYLWIRDKVKSGIITVYYPGKKDTQVSLEVKKAKTKITSYFENGEPKFNIEVNVESNVGELSSPIELENPEIISVLEDKQREALESQVKNTVDIAQKRFKLDILGLGDELAKRYPREWKKLKESWEEKFPDLEVQVTIKSKIRAIGLRTEAKINK